MKREGVTILQKVEGSIIKKPVHFKVAKPFIKGHLLRTYFKGFAIEMRWIGHFKNMFLFISYVLSFIAI